MELQLSITTIVVMFLKWHPKSHHEFDVRMTTMVEKVGAITLAQLVWIFSFSLDGVGGKFDISK